MGYNFYMLKFTQCKYTCWIFIDVYVFVTTTTIKIQKVPINLKSSLSLVVVQSLSCIWLFVTPWAAAFQASVSFTISWSLLKLMSIESEMPSNHLILCCPLLLPPSIFPSIRVLSSESVLSLVWPKYCSFSFSISPSNEYSGLIFFRINWFDLLAVQWTLKSLLQHYSSKASILQCSAFFIVQFLHPYMKTGKATALTRWTFSWQSNVSAFNILSRMVIREGNGNPLQYSCLENPVDGGAL